MYETWRGTAAHVLLAAAAMLGLGVALASSVAATGAAFVVAAWGAAGLLLAGISLSWAQYREQMRFRRSLAIGLTHHLRTSLASIQAYNEMLLLGNDSSEEERVRWLEIIGRETERIGAAVENVLLLVSRVRRGAYPVRRAIDLGAMLEDVACGYCATAAGPAFRFESGPPSGVMVDVDPNALRQALGNLFSTVGRVPGSGLTASLTTNGSKAMILVGMDDARPHVPDFASDTALREADLEGDTESGFGLEIAVARHVARAHGGRAMPFRADDRAGYRLELPISRG